MFRWRIGLTLRQKGIKAEGIQVTAHVTIGKNEDGGYALAVDEFNETIVGITPEVARRLLKRLIKYARTQSYSGKFKLER